MHNGICMVLLVTVILCFIWLFGHFWPQSWSLNLIVIVRGLLPPTASTPTSPTVDGLQLVGYTRLCRCEFTNWLLQHCACWCTKDSNGQVTACVERCCACRHRHLEVWPRPGSDTAWRTSLARRPRPGVFQAGSDSSPVSERPRTAVTPYLSDYCVPAAGVDTRQHQSINQSINQSSFNKGWHNASHYNIE